MRLREAYRACREQLERRGIENADHEALCLFEHVTGLGRSGLIIHGDEPLDSEKAELLNSLTEKRSTRYPLQYLLGSWSFMGLELEVGEGVLIPRDDTEVCVMMCLEYLKAKPKAKALDLCAGSGAISLALEKLAGADVTAVELSDAAFDYLKKNINKNNSGVNAVKGDVFCCHGDFEDGAYDLIVSNPPYIKRDELDALQTEVLYEPKTALDGGEDGFDFYRAIVKNWSKKLKKGGMLVFELGEGQADEVAAMMRAQGFGNIGTKTDLGGTQRAINGTML